MNKNPVLAFILSFIPGVGHFYLGKTFKGLFYLMSVFGLAGMSILGLAVGAGDVILVPIVLGLFIYIISFIDTVVALIKLPKDKELSAAATKESERFYTIVLSFIPGLGHFQLGLMNRGLTFLSAFLGLGILIFFLAAMTGASSMLVFMALLPIIWIYSFFDAIQQLNKKQRGEALVDKSVLEEFEESRESGKKSKTIATLFSIVPGAGHLYLGLQKRGLQLMVGFLAAIYILDILRLGLFFFIIPIIWFYSFFDGLQKASKAQSGELEDTPIISGKFNQQKWVGIALVVFGIYFLTVNIILPAVAPYINIEYRHIQYLFRNYFQTGLVCLLLIGGGIKLLSGSKKEKESAE